MWTMGRIETGILSGMRSKLLEPGLITFVHRIHPPET
jgi:hypothetical protein